MGHLFESAQYATEFFSVPSHAQLIYLYADFKYNSNFLDLAKI
jgi:hypothetical protein